ncbi:MAG: glycosyltransferase [Faecousia sp.]
MHIVYSVTTCSDGIYQKLFAHCTRMPAFQAQKYHRLLIEGLAANAQVDVVANPPGNRSCLKQEFLLIPEETEGGARYHYLPAIRNPVLKAVCVAGGVFWKTFCLARRDSAVVVDCLNRTAALSALLAAKARGCRCVGIITDLPDMLGGGRFSKSVANFVIRRCTNYVLLTEEMNRVVNPSGKPHVILEGHADIAMKDYVPSPERKASPRVCLYAGGVSRRYGLHLLVEGFQKANIPNTRLEIYGPGDYVKELENIAAEDSRVYYGGMLLNREIVVKEQEAVLLVNPRPTHEEYVKYSFPSKTMEYMASGTPVLTTRLPGMPREYAPYVFFIDEETVDGVARALERTLMLPDEALFAAGAKARQFVLEERNNVIQAQKILDMLK